MKINILHISDLHFAQPHLPAIKKVIEGLLRDLELIIIESPEKKPHILAFSGDIVFSGENSEDDYSDVQTLLIEPLIQKLSIERKNIFVIPGNHDVDRGQTSKVFEEGFVNDLKDEDALTKWHTKMGENTPEYGYLSKKFEQFEKFQKNIGPEKCDINSVFAKTFKTEVEGISLGFACINSAWLSSQYREDANNILVPEILLEQALSKISEQTIRVCLMHHPIDHLPLWNRSNVENIALREFDLILMGHVHNSNGKQIKPINGDVLTSAANALFAGSGEANGYSIISLDLAKKQTELTLRKWYSNRKEFDEETDKCKKGIVRFPLSLGKDRNSSENILIHVARKQLRQQSVSPSLIVPLEDINKVTLLEVFIEPVIRSSSEFESREKAGNIELKKILEGETNCIIVGHKEYGKTTLLKYLYDALLVTPSKKPRLPVYFEFSKIPKRDGDKFIKMIVAELPLEAEEVKNLLLNGDIVLLIDDLNLNTDLERTEKIKIIKEFISLYPKCRLVATTTEYLGPGFKQELIKLRIGLKAQALFLCSLTTSKVRDLLSRWGKKKSLNVEKTLEQISFYFHQLRVPVTPLAVTLFLGVLFREGAQKQIKNEAYLIENYLERLLEKTGKESNSNLDFKDKEAFLSYISYRLYLLERDYLTELEFETEKASYYTDIGEDLPHSSVFNDFFAKGILYRDHGTIRFTFRFWFSFFFARAMQKRPELMEAILVKSDYLKHAQALGYKAGLDRNDLKLLEGIRRKAIEAFPNGILIDQELPEIDSAIVAVGNKIEQELKHKNSNDNIDNVSDQLYYNNVNESSNELDDAITLITLHSDIIRTTSEISVVAKKEHILANIDFYLHWMFESFKFFEELVSEKDLKIIKQFMANLDKKKEDSFEPEKLIKKIKQVVFQLLPVSIILYLADHLAAPRHQKIVEGLIKNEANKIKQLFLMLLLVRIDLKEAIKYLRDYIEHSRSLLCDTIVALYLKMHCLEFKCDEKELDAVIKLLELLQKKHSAKATSDFRFRDTHIIDFRKRVMSQKDFRLG